MVDRVLAIGAGAPDLLLDAGPISGVLPDLFPAGATAKE